MNKLHLPGLKFIRPKRAYIEEEVLNYRRGKWIKEVLDELNIPVKLIKSHQGVRGIPGETSNEGYLEAKRTLVIGIKKSKKFQSCKPSAHYQLPVATSCPGMCQYCYLSTTLGKKPYVRAYINFDEILDIADRYVKERSPEETIFEGAATSDPLPVEDLTGNLKECINYFAKNPLAWFRFVTKFTNVDSLLNLNHNKKTKIRFSVNSDYIINNFEKNTPSLNNRLKAATKVSEAGYPTGFLIAPIVDYPNWKRDYKELLLKLKNNIGNREITFELITHRYTKKAKNQINEIFPQNVLPMTEEDRKFKYGQFGYGKYIYPGDKMSSFESFFSEKITELLPNAKIEYFV